MSKPVKELVRRELARRFEGVRSLAVVDFTGVDAVATSEIRQRLVSKGVRVTVVKNSLARQAFKSIGMDAAADLLEGPCAVATGGDSVVDVVRELLEIRKEQPNLTVKAALLEGDAFGRDRIDELSRYPTRDEAISRMVGCALAPGARLAGCLIGPGGRLASILKTLEDRAEDAAPEEVKEEALEAAEATAEAAEADSAAPETVEAPAEAEGAATADSGPQSDVPSDSSDEGGEEK